MRDADGPLRIRAVVGKDSTLDLVYPFRDHQAIVQSRQVTGAIVSSDFTADAACANLVRNRSCD